MADTRWALRGELVPVGFEVRVASDESNMPKFVVDALTCDPGSPVIRQPERHGP